MGFGELQRGPILSGIWGTNSSQYKMIAQLLRFHQWWT